jgi:heptose-I-phosphate ethanolaminephosphotransferase
LASLSGIFSFGAMGQSAPAANSQHILAMARAAGYRIWWMSNHDDIAIDQQHAQFAHTVEMINRQPGRGSARLDSELLDDLEEALSDPAERKLVVVHLLGAHPDYRRRVPEGMRPFDAGDDAVEAQMINDGRSLWVREMRQAYDAAIRFHDGVVTQTARLTRQHARSKGQAAWLYLSDHGQEVGHSVNRTGHSAATEAGYRIPALVWRNSAPMPAQAQERPFRADWAGWLLMDLMNVRWDSMVRTRNVLGEAYVWEPPPLPLRSVQFHR